MQRLQHLAQYADDDGGFLRIFVGKYYATPPPAAQFGSILIATNASYHLSTPNDGSFGSWVEMDPNLRVTQVPAVSGSSIVSANLDLWTARAGYNQDVGIFVATDGGPDLQLGWKESGGYAGTFSPNAAFVETVLPVLAGHTYVFTLKWKPNRPAPEQTIYAGAGAAGTRFSPTRLTVRLLPASSVARAVQRKSYHLEGAGDGIAWAPVDPLLDVARQGTGAALRVSANMDLWTAQPGYNQDLGLFASDNGGPDALIAWKESGGFAGTYSPNAAFVNAEYPTLAGHNYVFRLKWKTNVAAPEKRSLAVPAPPAPSSRPQA